MSATDIITDAMKLSIAERAKIAQELLRSLDQSSDDQDAEATWDEELRARSNALHDGRQVPIDTREVIDRLKARLTTGE